MDFKGFFEAAFVAVRFFEQDIDPVSLHISKLDMLRELLDKRFRGFVRLTINDDFLAGIEFCRQRSLWLVTLRDGRVYEAISFELAEEWLFRELFDLIVKFLTVSFNLE